MKKNILAIVLLIVGLTLIQAQDSVIAQGNNLTEKFDWLNIFVQSNTSYIVEVRANETIRIQTLSFRGKSGITITLRGIGVNRTIVSSTNGIFSVGSDNTLVLDSNIILHGGVVYVERGGTFIMNGGTISGNSTSSNTGSEITYFNCGGGVNVGGNFAMDGGTISGNSARENGGGVYIYEGSFTKSGGTIYGYSTSNQRNSNVIKNSSGGVQNFRGHALFADYDLLKIKEGTAGPGDNMSYSYNGRTNPPTARGAWDN